MDLRASVLIAVYNGVRELELVLSGFRRQSCREFEVVIADDGSGPEMRAFVESFLRDSPFPLQYVSQPDEGFRKCRILNQAVRLSSAPYLIFIDADCIPHPHFVQAHLEQRAPRAVLCGRRVNLSPAMTRALTPQEVIAGKLDGFPSRLVLDALLGRAGHLEEGVEIRHAGLRRWLHRRAEPVLFGCNYSLEKSLLEEVNGFNEDFVDYWGEDMELGYRLRAAGAELRWVRHSAMQYHLYHAQRAKTERSCELLERARIAPRPICENGLRKIESEDTAIEPSLSEPALPKELADYLAADNPRLVDLRGRYAGHPAAAHSQWSQPFVANNLDLRRFRADNAYVWQSRGPVTEQTYVRTADYVRQTDRLHAFDRVNEDGMFGAQWVEYRSEKDGPERRKISRDLLDSVLEMNAVCDFLGINSFDGLRLLDVGAGYGRLAQRIVEAFSGVKEIVCTDAIPESTFLSEFYLKFREVESKTVVIPLDQIQDEMRKRAGQIDVAVNIHSFSECTLASIRWWLDLLRSAEIPRLFIVPNFAKRLVSTEVNGKREDFGKILPDYGYRKVFEQAKFVKAPELQKTGLYPTWYYGFELRRSPSTTSTS
jgi:glycosyltransferase involved in cell wall biosynthesis